MAKLILDGKDYGDDYIAYNRDYNNKVWEQLRMKQLKDIERLTIVLVDQNDGILFLHMCVLIYLVPFYLQVCFLHYT